MICVKNTPWTQDINWTYIIRSIYVVSRESNIHSFVFLMNLLASKSLTLPWVLLNMFKVHFWSHFVNHIHGRQKSRPISSERYALFNNILWTEGKGKLGPSPFFKFRKIIFWGDLQTFEGFVYLIFSSKW